MPQYVFKCPVCGAERVVQLAIDERDSPVWCMEGEPPRRMERQLTAPNFTITGFAAKNGYSGTKGQD